VLLVCTLAIMYIHETCKRHVEKGLTADWMVFDGEPSIGAGLFVRRKISL